VPCVLPLAGVLGWLGWTGTTLSFSAAVVGSIVLGMTSDDTLHYLVRVERDRLAPGRALVRLGPAFVGTTSVLVAGAAVTSMGEAKPVALFARLLALGVALALVANLLVTPRLHALLRPRRRGGPRP
jgi:predicted RND superfamily exporter protein